MEPDLRASVRRSYRLPGKCLLVLDDTYEGGVETGDWIEIKSGDRTLIVQVDGVAWGSAFKAENPPLSLIVLWGDQADPEAGSKIRTVPSPQR